jgi:acetolactate synthase-1/2/3 large subunit
LTIEGNDWGVREENTTNSPAYNWIDKLCESSKEGDIIIPDMGQIGCIAFQRWKPKKNQSLFNGMNHSPMGYSIPASIGATIATNRPVKVIIGDGSFMMNMHDLQTIKDYDLPIDVYVVNNGGYGMIRQTQNDWKQYLEQGIACNFKIPDIKLMANAFGIGDKVHEIKFEDTTIQPKWKYGNEL